MTFIWMVCSIVLLLSTTATGFTETSSDVKEALDNLSNIVDNKLDGIVERLDQLEFVVKELTGSAESLGRLEKSMGNHRTEKTARLDKEFKFSKLPSRWDVLEILAGILQLKVEERTLEILKNVSDKVDSLEVTLEKTRSQIIESVNTSVQLAGDRVSEKLEFLEVTVNNTSSQIEEKVDTSVNLSEESFQLATTIKTRQEAWISEVRLVSLFKLTDENDPRTSGNSGDFNPGLLVDGQFLFDAPDHTYTRTWSHTGSDEANNEIWIKLGGLFRVYSIRVWNRRDSDVIGRFPGTTIYVDSTPIGSASGTWGFYDFTLLENDVVYGSTVTLIQPRSEYLHLLEVQVWGNGPYDSTDVFN